VPLTIDWNALGLDPKKAKLYAPSIQGIQGEDVFAPDEPLPVEPGKGWMLILDETKRTLQAEVAANAYDTRKLLLEDDFSDKAWKTVLSKRKGTTIKVEKGTLVIDATANTCAFVERPLPEGVTLVECVLDRGTDGGQTWGLGLGLAWPKGQFVRIHLRAEDKRFGYDDARKVYFGPSISSAPQRVRVRLEPEEVVLEYLSGVRRGKEQWRAIGRLDRKLYPGSPALVRIGKMNAAGRNGDFPQPGGAGVCRASGLKVWGEK